MEPRSPSNLSPAPCWKCLSANTALPLCSHCGALQDVPSQLDHFRLLGVDPGLRLDAEALRDRFYALSRDTHPDRYARVAPPESAFALRWTTAVNRAYQLLRDPVARSRYLLELHGRREEGRQIPMELAESYFELQDLLGEPGGDSRLQAFKTELEALLVRSGSEWEKLASDWNSGGDRNALLDALEKHLTFTKYVTSMIRDIERKQGSAP